ncbi:putative tRNA-splicing endonuclease, subunit Sen54 [Helianthus anomalus]
MKLHYYIPTFRTCFIICRFMAKIGALELFDDDEKCIPSEDTYKKVGGGVGGSSWESFEVYRHLKSLGYIIKRHDVCAFKAIKGSWAQHVLFSSTLWSAMYLEIIWSYVNSVVFADCLICTCITQ